MAPFRWLERYRIDPYLPLLIGTVALASVAPARGMAAGVVSIVTNLAIGGLFFLYGARLTTKTILQGVTHWRLQGLVLISTFVLFPLLGGALLAVFGRAIDPALAMGIMFVCILPSTVQSSIAFTSIARGNVPAALCCASLSNVIGVVLTPLLTALLLTSEHATVNLETLRDIFFQLLLPFALGQLARPWLGEFITRHRKITSLFDRGSILLVVYEAFGAGMVAGVWRRVDVESLLAVAALDVALLGIVLVSTTFVSRALGFNKEDEITIVFCGSKKSMASGIPMANILFPAQTAGLVVIPLMLFHQAQLFACAILAQRYAQRERAEAVVDTTLDATLAPREDIFPRAILKRLLNARSKAREVSMDLKDIVLLTDEASVEANAYAFSIAASFKAHLTATSFSIDLQSVLAYSDGSVAIVADALAQAAKAAEDLAKNVAASASAQGLEATGVSISLSGAVGQDAGPFLRSFDLIVVEQPKPDFPGQRRDLIDAALFDSGRPVLIVPYVQRAKKIESVLIAWKDTRQTARAVADALPWLKRAKQIEIVYVGSAEDADKSLRRLQAHLFRHEAQASFRVLSADGSVADAVLSHAADVGADLLVMGGYGHSRFREIVLGGVTRGILASMTLPVLMAH